MSGDDLEASLGKEADRAVVRGPERINPAFGARQRARSRCAEPTPITSRPSQVATKARLLPSCDRANWGETTARARSRTRCPAPGRWQTAHRAREELPPSARRSFRRRPTTRRLPSPPGSATPSESSHSYRCGYATAPPRPLSRTHVNSCSRSRDVCQRSSGSFAGHRQDMIEAGGSQRLHGRQSWRLAFDDGRHHAGLAAAFERLPAGHHLEEHRAKREHVGSRINRSPPQSAPAPCCPAPCRGSARDRSARDAPVQRGLASPRRRCRQSDPEVEQLGATLGQHDVARLDVPVDEAGAVGAVEGRGNLNRTDKGLIAGERALLQPRRQCLALEGIP